MWIFNPAEIHVGFASSQTKLELIYFILFHSFWLWVKVQFDKIKIDTTVCHAFKDKINIDFTTFYIEFL